MFHTLTFSKLEEIYNADETGLTEVHVPPKVIVKKD